MNTANLQQVSVADRVNAPYGAAAASIIGAMGQYSTPITSGCTATTINTPDLYEYANIALTFDAIVSNACIDAGWVSWAQIKSAGVSTAKYITFPSFAIAQTGVRLTGAIPSASAAAAADALWNFANFTSPNAANGALGGSWNDWLEAHGYGAIPSQTNP
jgi:hypothetical protein